MNRILLIIEDDAVRLFFREELLDEGYDVVDAGGYSCAPEIIRKLKPDLLLGNLRMTGEDCLETLQEIRQGHAGLPVILCTFYPLIHFDIRPFATDYLMIGSSDLGDLKSRIRLALNKKTETLEETFHEKKAGYKAGKSSERYFKGYEKEIGDKEGLPWGH